MKYKDSNITFNSVPTSPISLGGQIRASESGYNVNFVDSLKPDYVMSAEQKGEPVINSIDINWNKAEVNGTEIETTGQLLNKIATIETFISSVMNNA